MPPRRSQKYLSSSGNSFPKKVETPPLILSQNISRAPTAALIVNWLSASSLSFSDCQWLIFTQYVCSSDLIRFEKLPGSVTFSAPYLNIQISSFAQFEEFKKQAILTPRNPKFQVRIVQNIPGFVTCNIIDA